MSDRAPSVLRHTALDLGDVERPLSDYAGKVLLIVNVASFCGYTPQYAGLEALHRQFAPRGFSVLAFPCNQFGKQEPGTAEDIRQFCAERYSVTFPVFKKISVNGPDAHPLFRELTERCPGIVGTRAIKWNFTKFLIDREGRAVRRYAPRTVPEKIADDVAALLGRGP